MKKIILIITSIFFINIYAQERCAFDPVHKELLKNRKYSEQVKKSEMKIKANLQRKSAERVEEILTIPVVVHVMHLGEPVGSGSNISDAQIHSAINHLTEFYRGRTTNSPVDFKIEFTLAKRTPDCNPTTGIIRVNASNVANYSTQGVSVNGGAGADKEDIKALSTWPTKRYFNIWIVPEFNNNNGGGGIQGFANFYYGNPTEGSMMMTTAFGYDLGNTNGWGLNLNGDNSTVIHEIGHYLHLYHTFEGDKNNTVCPTTDPTLGDFCADTEPHKRDNVACIQENNCTNKPWINNTQHNMMSYYTCVDRLTNDQKTRARSAMEGTSIVNSTGSVPLDLTFDSPTQACAVNNPTFQLPITKVSLNGVTFNPDTSKNVDDTQRCFNFFTLNTDAAMNTISVTVDSGSPTNAPFRLGIWVDWNDDGDFNDNEEQQYLGVTSSTTRFETVEHQITLPTKIPYKDYVRVRMQSDFSQLTTPTGCGGLKYGHSVDYMLKVATNSFVWTGSVDRVWNKSGNWYDGIVPTSTDNVIIPNVSNKPIIRNSVVVNDLLVQQSSLLIVDNNGNLEVKGDLTSEGGIRVNTNGAIIVRGSFTGSDVFYDLTLTDKWHLVSNPFANQDIDGFINTSSNNIALSSTSNNRALAPYDNTKTQPWIYIKNGTSNNGNFKQGKGYSIKRVSSGNVRLKGSVTTNTIPITVSGSSSNAFNLVGNPFLSYLNLNMNANVTNNFLTFNDNKLQEQTVWLWDGTANSGSGVYRTVNQTNQDVSVIHPGQGFFVKTKTGSQTLNFSNNLQSITKNSFYRANNDRSEIILSAKNGSITKTSQLLFIQDATDGFDNGYDSSIFEGEKQEFDIYTGYINGDVNKFLAIQSFDNNSFEKIIPLGVTAKENSSVIFSVNVNNIPNDLKVYIEDRLTRKLINLIDTDYTVQFTSGFSGLDRFNIRITPRTLSYTDSLDKKEVAIYNSLNSISVKGFNELGTLQVFDINGRKVFSDNFEASYLNTFKVPSLSKGVYIVNITSSKTKISRKIVL